MDGSYGNVFGGTPPMSPGTPTSNNEQYKVNVSRQKTRKWAEFKPQNYEGDDWGADYDDGSEDTPPPPPKPAGPRQPSAPPPASRQFTPVGAPPLQVQTQRAFSVPMGPASAGGVLDRTAVEQIVSPQSTTLQSPTTVSTLYSGTPPLSGHPAAALPLRSRSPAAPAPLSAGPVPTRFPPRKSSMGAYDAAPPLTGSAPQSRSSSRPGSSQGASKPWTEVRSSSPVSARSPIVSPAKPLPFVRPADIYRRMEEVREKERRSMESAGRPSLDSLGSAGRSNERPESGVLPQRPLVLAPQEPAERKRVEEGADASRHARPSLPSVAERKSEYGLEGLIASYGAEDDTVEQEPFPPRTTTGATVGTTSTAPEQPKSISGSKLASSEPRRFSTSPKLPELGRMSGFGADLFSIPSRFSSGLSSLPPDPDNSQPSTATTQSMAPPVEPAASVAAPSTEPDVAERVHARDSGNVVQADATILPTQRTTEIRPASPPNEPNRHFGLPTDASQQQQQQHSAAEASRQVASSVEDKHAVQPSLLGGQSPAFAATRSENPTLAVANISRAITRKAVDSGEVSPLTQSNDSAEDLLAKAGKSQQTAIDGVSDVASETSAAKRRLSNSSHHSSPLALPPLRTASPAGLSTLAQMSSHADDGDAAPPSQTQDAKTAESGLASPEATTSPAQEAEITPTAPLNPRNIQRADVPEDILPPPGFEVGSMIDTTSSSPVKESDMLREEIIKSLSPLGPSDDYLESAGRDTSAYHAAAGGPARESSYLPDVYGDYWAATEEKAVPVPSVPNPGNMDKPSKIVETATSPSVDAAAQVPLPVSATLPAQDQARVAPSAAEGRHGELRKRFSWETDSQRPATGAPAEQRSPACETGNVIIAEPTLASPVESPSSPLPILDTASLPTQGSSGGISHKVSEASTIPPGKNMEIPAEPPSPVSLLSDRTGPPPDNLRQSLADEKALVQSSATPLYPSPPLDQHPAVVAEGMPYPPPGQPPATTEGPPYPPPTEHSFVTEGIPFPPRESAAAPPTPTKSDIVSIMTFRQIMSIPISSERVKTYSETRSKFAAIDTGLNEWMSIMASRHPEHAAASSSFGASLMNPGVADAQQGGGQAPSQGNAHIYSQQPGASTQAFGQNIPMPPTPPHGSIGFGHSSGQVGVKSKKLLLAAGKAGKGLLSKGKNKLSVTGEKVFSNT